MRAVITIAVLAILSVCFFTDSVSALSPRPTMPAPSSRVSAVAFSPDGKLLASGGFDGYAKIWHVGSGKLAKTLTQSSEPVGSLDFSPDGRILACESGDRVRLWDTENWTVRRLHTAKPYVSQVVFAPDGKSLAAAAVNVYVWDIATGKTLRVMEDSALCLGYTRDGHIVTGNWDGEMIVRDSMGRTLLRVKANELDLRSLSVSRHGNMVACGGWGDTVRIFDSSTGNMIRSIAIGESSAMLVCFSPDSKSLAVGNGIGVKLVDTVTGKTIRQLKDGKSAVQSIAFNPGGDRIAVGYEDGTLRLWNTANGKVIHKIRAHTSRLIQR